jgi:hypothetical protein
MDLYYVNFVHTKDASINSHCIILSHLSLDEMNTQFKKEFENKYHEARITKICYGRDIIPNIDILDVTDIEVTLKILREKYKIARYNKAINYIDELLNNFLVKFNFISKHTLLKI